MRHAAGHSTTKTLNTGSPLGCVLSPMLFILYTNDMKATQESNTVIKFADDTAVIGRISSNNETPYRDEINRIVDWCADNNLLVNGEKTK